MRKALDTNIVVRFLLDDGSKEVPIAREVFRQESVEIPSSVVLECEWVLRSIYKIKPKEICDAFSALLSLENVLVHNEHILVEAIQAHRQGVDFADAFHLLFAEKSDEFFTFDDDFKKSAKRLQGTLPVRKPTLASLGRKP